MILQESKNLRLVGIDTESATAVNLALEELRKSCEDSDELSLIGVLSEYNEGNKFFFVTLAKFNGHEINLIKVSLEYGIETHGNLIVRDTEELQDTNYEQTEEELKKIKNAVIENLKERNMKLEKIISCVSFEKNHYVICNATCDNIFMIFVLDKTMNGNFMVASSNKVG